MSEYIPATRVERTRPNTDWHLVCVTKKGVVSILKNLDWWTAIETYRRLMPGTRPRRVIWPNCQECLRMGVSYGRTMNAGDFASVEAIGPEGEEFLPWANLPTAEHAVDDYSPLCPHTRPVEAEPSATPLIVAITPTAFEERALREAGTL